MRLPRCYKMSAKELFFRLIVHVVVDGVTKKAGNAVHHMVKTKHVIVVKIDFVDTVKCWTLANYEPRLAECL